MKDWTKTEKHEEFVVLYKDGMGDWIDPVEEVQETETEIIIGNGLYVYTFKKEEIEEWDIRPYSIETTHDPV